MKKNEQGTSIIELLLILLILIILGLLGWYIWQAKKDNKPKGSDASTPSSIPASKTEAQKKADTSQPAALYLKIPEWGIKIKLTDDIKDAYYDAAKQPDAFNLRVKSLDSETDCKTGDLSVAAIFKVGKDEKYPQDETKTYAEAQKGVVIGDSFYFTGVAQYSCTQNAGYQTLLTKVRTAFTNASAVIEKL